MRVRIRRIRRIEALIAELGSRDQRAALRAEGRLIKIGTPAVEALMAAATNEDAQVRFRAVWALGKIGDRRALSVIIRLTGDRDPRVAFDAATVLDELKGETRGPADTQAVL